MSVSSDSFGGVSILPVQKASTMGTCLALYGAGGVGKTVMAGKLGAKYGPLLYIDAEGGAASIRSLDGIAWAPVTKFREIEAIARALGSDNPYKTVVIDNMSEIQNLCIQSIAGSGAIQIQHWGECTASLLRLTRTFRELTRFKQLNVVFIAWDDTDKDENGVVIKKGVGFTPSLARQFPGIVSMVGHITVYDRVPNTRILSFRASTKSDAKFRVDSADAAASIPQELYVSIDSNPLEDVFNTIYEGKKFPAAKYEKPKAN